MKVNFLKLAVPLIFGAVALGVVTTGASAALSLDTKLAPVQTSADNALVQNVWWHYGWHRWGGWHYGWHRHWCYWHPRACGW